MKNFLNYLGHLRPQQKLENATFAATSSHFWDIYFTFLKVKALQAITDAGIEVYHKVM